MDRLQIIRPAVRRCQACEKPLRKEQKRFCSKSCWSATVNAPRTKNPEPRSCQTCGTPLTRKQLVHHPDTKSCSRRCQTIARNKRRGKSLRDAFYYYWNKMDKPADPRACWIWPGPIGEEGYGRLKNHGKHYVAHALSYFFHNNLITIPPLVRHSYCDNPPCIRPTHLLDGTSPDNTFERHMKGRTARGSQSGGAKLNDAQVILIKLVLLVRKLRYPGYVRYRNQPVANHRIGKWFGVSAATIIAIEQGKTWTHIQLIPESS